MKELRYITSDKRIGRILCEDDRVEPLTEAIIKIGGGRIIEKSISQLRTLVRK